MDDTQISSRPLVVLNHIDQDEGSSQQQNDQDNEGQQNSSNSSIAEDSVFANFDGVHNEVNTPEPGSTRQHSPAPASDSLTEVATQTDTSSQARLQSDEMVYDELAKFQTPHIRVPGYPAPIPKYLRLPPRLSNRLPQEEYARRRTQILSQGEGSNIPPQLRAALFFEQPVENPQYEFVRDGLSPSQVLDKLLELGVDMPVTAFTDNPWVAGAGGVYDTDPGAVSKGGNDTLSVPKKPFYKRASHSVLKFAGITSEPNLTGVPVSMPPEEDDDATEDQRPRQAQEFDQVPSGPPSTLVAELQLRKQQQRLRNRPGLEAVLDGARSTLLEMDTVAEIEQQKRKIGKTKLAWEQGPREEDVEEDIPLGMLYRDQRKPRNPIPRPHGTHSILLQRDLEDTEPLSVRRRRLQQEARAKQSQSFGLEVPGVTDAAAASDDDDEDDGETLAQRMKRLKAGANKKHQRRISAEFSKEMMNQLGA